MEGGAGGGEGGGEVDGEDQGAVIGRWLGRRVVLWKGAFVADYKDVGCYVV